MKNVFKRCNSSFATRPGMKGNLRLISYNISSIYVSWKRCYLVLSKGKEKDDFPSWCAGLIDGDGSFLLSKSGAPSCEITLGEGEEDILFKIKERLGGSISHRGSRKAYRWRLHNLLGMAHLLSLVHNRCRLPLRIAQCERVAQQIKESSFLKKRGAVLNFSLNTAEEETPISSKGGIHGNSWLAGFFDAEGYFHVNRSTLQGSITLSQKTPELLEDIREELGGGVYFDTSWKGYLYAASSAEHCERWFSYFKKYPLQSKKKSAKLVQFKRYRLFLSRGYHRLKEEDRKYARFHRLLKELSGKKSTI